ncbi:MAG: tripartite tricarboxylate transporter substrate binding protein [Burkholderiales bacterium]|nr:tripartite tricarboxylate transporter substrate binding protein [Burkholderiales bacterium]MCW5575358.1 tripartite tricarboxylate transporter substrate binding protein [Burkholderiales bacterium]
MLRTAPIFAAAVAAVLAAAPMTAAAQAYPNKPIRLIVPFPPGGGTDLVSRLMQPALVASLGQQVLIDSRGGAQGSLGTAIAATANPDGYTVVIAEIGATAVAPALMSNLSFDIARDFAGISQLIEQPYIMTVHPSVQVNTLAEFIKLAQSKPGSMNFGSGNVTAHIAQEAFFQTAGVKLVHIPYRGSGPSVAAAVGGEVQTLFSGPGAAIPQIKAGKLRALAVTTTKRAAQLPDVPTLAEAGYKGFAISGWYGLMGPIKMPKEAVDTLNKAVTTVLKGETGNALRARGYDPVPTTPAEFDKFMRAEITRWSKAVKQYNIKPDF